MASAGKVWLLFCLLLGGCVANDRSTLPSNAAPVPPQDVITVGGFDDAMHIGSDYIYASQLPDRVFVGAQQLPGNLWLLRFGPGANPAGPVDLVVDPATGTVVREVPAAGEAEAELKATPTLPAPVSDTPSTPEK
jgi:hypothetical protein